MQHSEASRPIVVEYAHMPRPTTRRRLTRCAVLALLFFASPVVLWVGIQCYVAHEWGQLTSGMTRAQVDRQLWAFRSYPFPQYSGLGPGEFVIRYELFRMSKATMIQVIYNPDGTVADAQPIFDN